MAIHGVSRVRPTIAPQLRILRGKLSKSFDERERHGTSSTANFHPRTVRSGSESVDELQPEKAAIPNLRADALCRFN